MATTKSGWSRRGFVGLLSTLGIGAVGLTACGNGTTAAPATAAASAADPHAGMAMATPSTDGELTADEMDKMHEAGVKAFPAKTSGLGGQPLEFRREGEFKVFDLVVKKVQWEIEPGKFSEAWTYNGTLPGPEIRVTEGDKVRVVVKNELDQSTAVHFHGLVVPNAMDGVPFITQPPIKPGTNFTYEFVAKPAGTHMYHSHHNAAQQVGMGLLGAFIVEPKDPSSRPAFDIESTLILNDGVLGYTLNGKGFPATQPIVCKQGQKVLLRYINEGSQLHPMHLHGMPQLVIARDGYLLHQPYLCDTLTIGPGERWEAIVDATELGTWAFHCHILSHAESEHGMFGMVTVLVVQP
jgi:FtsP/CotA-like multicopper oxidase with cupredoxin domain